MGVFGLVLGSLLLAFDGVVFSAVEWVVNLSRSDSNNLSPKIAEAVKDGIDIWGWAGLVVAAITLPLGNERLRSRLARAVRPISAATKDDRLPPDRYGATFFLAIIITSRFEYDCGVFAINGEVPGFQWVSMEV